jgi:hypothetical protein
MMTASESSSQYVKWIPQLPILGGLLAISYDVGYFWGVDITYYSLFSLTEHIVFATQALPVAVIIAILFVFAQAFANRYRSAIDTEKTSAESVRWFSRRGRCLHLLR